MSIRYQKGNHEVYSPSPVKRIGAFTKRNPELFEQLVKESTTDCSVKQNKPKSKSKSLGTLTQPGFEHRKGLLGLDGNIYRRAPGFFFF
jgi:hypothetical protein